MLYPAELPGRDYFSILGQTIGAVIRRSDKIASAISIRSRLQLSYRGDFLDGLSTTNSALGDLHRRAAKFARAAIRLRSGQVARAHGVGSSMPAT